MIRNKRRVFACVVGLFIEYDTDNRSHTFRNMDMLHGDISYYVFF